MRKFNFLRSCFMAVVLITGSLTFSSCDSEEIVEPVIEENGPRGPYDQAGVFVVNEGNFGTPNGSISFFSDSTGKQVQNRIFNTVNKRLLGDVVQNMVLIHDRAFLVVNNSNKMEVTDAYTFKSVGAVEGLIAPRYFAALSENKGYITEWLRYDPVTYAYSNGRVSVIDLDTYTVIKTIEVGVQPEKLLITGGKLYVTNQGGNTVTVINTTTDVVAQNIEVSDGPNSLVLDKNNALWVLAGGKKVYAADWSIDETRSTAASLTKINTATNTVTTTLTFPSKTASASKLLINGSNDKLFYIYASKVYQHDINATALNTTELIGRSFYGLGVHPVSGNIYGGDSNGFTADGTVHIYNPAGAKISEFRVGIGPNGFVFR